MFDDDKDDSSCPNCGDPDCPGCESDATLEPEEKTEGDETPVEKEEDLGEVE